MNISKRKIFLSILLLVCWQVGFAEFGCYVRDGNRELYTFSDGTLVNLCGTNTQVFTESSKAIRDAGCMWEPVSPAGSYNCIVMPGGLCGIRSSYVLECSLDGLSLALLCVAISGLGMYKLRKATMPDLM